MSEQEQKVAAIAEAVKGFDLATILKVVDVVQRYGPVIINLVQQLVDEFKAKPGQPK